MPVYEVRCPECGERALIVRKMDQRDENLPRCFHGDRMVRIISAPFIAPDLSTPFSSPNDPNRWITSRAEWKEDLKRSNAIPWEPGLDRDIASNKQHQIDAAFRPIEAAIDSTVSSMVAAGKLET